MSCQKCICKCQILSISCLEKADGRIKGMCLSDHPELIEMVDSLILIGTTEKGGILGQKCYNELCNEINKAEELAQQWNEANPSTDAPQGSRDFYLPEKWKAFLNNPHFRNMYAAYIVYYYYISGNASSVTKKDGDINVSRSSGTNNGFGGKHIDYAESARRAKLQLSIAKQFQDVFMNTFWKSGQYTYDCRTLPCGCHDSCGCKKDDCSKNKLPNKIKKRKSVAL